MKKADYKILIGRVAASAVLALLVACGGGSDGNSSPGNGSASGGSGQTGTGGGSSTDNGSTSGGSTPGNGGSTAGNLDPNAEPGGIGAGTTTGGTPDDNASSGSGSTTGSGGSAGTDTGSGSGTGTTGGTATGGTNGGGSTTGGNNGGSTSGGTTTGGTATGGTTTGGTTTGGSTGGTTTGGTTTGGATGGGTTTGGTTTGGTATGGTTAGGTTTGGSTGGTTNGGTSTGGTTTGGTTTGGTTTGGSTGGTTTGGTGTPPAPTVSPITKALSSGDPSGLSTANQKDLLSQAISTASALQQWQQGALQGIYGLQLTDLSLNHGTNSSSITATKTTIAAPLILSDNGTGMAAIARVGTGRGLAYGADVLGWMAGTTREQQHLPLFTRAFTWLVTGNGAGKLPATLQVGVAGYDANNVKLFAARAGVNAVLSTCKVDDPTNTCWSSLNLIVFGAKTTDSPGLAALVRRYLEAGKSVIYMHPNWIDSTGGRTVLGAMGMSLGGYPGNYYASAAAVSVGSGRTRADTLARADQFGALITTLGLLQRTDLTLDFTDTTPLKPIDAVMSALASLQSRGINVFADPDSKLYPLLVLWADVQRRSQVYGTPLSSKGDSDDFLRAYASDSWLVFNRTTTTIPPKGAGDYMPAAAASIAVSNSYEDIDVTIAQTSGITLIGRGAIPGKPVTIQIVDAAGATGLGVQTSYVRSYGDPVADKTYARPRRPQSFNIPLTAGTDNSFVTPFGGPLELRYSGATAGTVVKLRIKGAAKYAHFDFTRNPSQAEIDEAVAALKRADFGWQTSKLVGGEIQQTIGYAQKVIGTTDPKVYVVDRIKGILFDSNHYANGYNNMPMSALAQNVCTQLGWTCDGPLHRAPNVQHFIGWIAACGFLCSGNPSDGFAGIDVGWGWAHELGHNTVQRVMHIAPNGKGCVVECDNNILASATMLREYALIGVDTGHNLDHTGLYADIVANRGTGLADEALRADMEVRLWQGASQDPMRAVHFQMAFQYAKLRAGLAKPTMDSTLEFFQLLTKADRLVAKAWDANNKGKYGMGRFANNTISNEDLFYVLSSKIIGQDMRKHFAMYGIPLSQTALDSISDLGLPAATRGFYALANGKHNQLATGQWLDIETSMPAYPF
ncbi:ImpA family metalloprotease [Niveibacterium umoris]|uniref:Peptidase M60 domain-containing protein n=1 Tax=Niveibacterium umoris TaxID=1193620 RepID=A0A840BDV3_9RHOO|nr:ImpA family metalloprotease [Niveibacterium umoris]MBB4011711.1 hypothetical protein [Niveibacterium umoris]